MTDTPHQRFSEAEKRKIRRMEQLIDALWKDLSKPDAYGPQITREHVSKRVLAMAEGDKPKNGPDMFIEGALKKAGVIR
jgi:hypothetical protein